jgi:hypothetical protein
MNFSLLDAAALKRASAAKAGAEAAQKYFAQIDASRQGSITSDPVRGAFQNEDGSWTATFKAGMVVGVAPVSNRKRLS